MTKAQERAATMTIAEKSVLFRMEGEGIAIAPGAWTVTDYEIIELSPELYRPIFVSRDFGYGHTLTAFGKRVKDAAKAIEAQSAETTGSARKGEGAVSEGDLP